MLRLLLYREKEDTLQPLTNLFEHDKDVQSILHGVQTGLREQLATGLTGSARMILVATMYKKTGRTCVVVTHNMNQAQKAADDLSELLSKEEVLLYPADELITTEVALASPETLGNRIDVITRLTSGFSGVFVVPFSGLRKIFPPKSTWNKCAVSLSIGDTYPITTLSEKLVYMGYERVDMVEKSGEFSVRGGIVDIYPVTFEQPIRMEWFDDEVDSIRPFSVADQRSIDKLLSVVLPPAKELFADVETLYQAGEHVRHLLTERLEKTKDPALKEKLQKSIGWDIEQLQSGIYFTGIYKYISQIYPQGESILNFLPMDAVLILDEPARIQETAKQLEREEAEWQTALLEQGEMLPSLKLSYTIDEVWKTEHQKIYLSLFMRQLAPMQANNIVQFMCRSMQQFHSQMHVLKAELERLIKAKYIILFTASSEERLLRLIRVLQDYGMEVSRIDDTASLPAGKPVVRVSALLSGFEMSSTKLAVITEGEVFTQKQRRVRRSTKLDHAEKIKDYQELKPGDYVVHINHGIGKYLGIETLNVAGLHKDYMHIQYAGNDKLYVPVEQIDQVQKYVGSEEKIPKVYSLGGSEWSKVKNKVRTAVVDIAQDLIKLYAKRQEARGYAFHEDTPFQREFEAMFPYEETPDQLRSIVEIKKDMEQSQPMDRLLCGDVGYGKTEVAVRAAFKAIMDGKQVAVLVPTTILAQQHYETFRERFADFPIEVHVLNRFRSRKEQKETIEGLKAGSVDIVIGTHRVLSKDLGFRDLGLLIIDEEQRFGVKHKERIKELKTNIDVLTLTATPIPRTLHMAMMGVRDLSVIETPPENRFPVQTYVIEYSAALVREAIERELSRGGQVYFLYNQVNNIDRMADQIRMLVPEARIAVAHGQMVDTELERVMLDFLDGEYDVLVSTTIIETGVDIPNVNTLIIYNADKMGLSQLYQLRGRVGRSNRIAYAYFTYQRDKVLSETAEKRLQAIKEFTELGSGFKIAMRDLSIRGAGNLLGAEQHGHIATVGFEMYSQMLKEAVVELQQGVSETHEVTEPQLDLNVDAYLPSEYITDEKQKIELYKKIRSLQTLEQVSDLEEEMEDRFGDLPDPVQNLIRVAKLRAYAMKYGIESMVEKGTEIHVTLRVEENARINGQELFKLAHQFPGRIRLVSGKHVGMIFKKTGLTPKAILETMDVFFKQYEKVRKVQGVVQSATID
jgi:transcription-repair coupling factor (superfamily II helicase)